MNMWLTQVWALTNHPPPEPPLPEKQKAGLQCGVAATKSLVEFNRRKVLSAIVKNPGCSAKWIKEETGLSRETVSQHLTELRNKGKIVRSSFREWHTC